MEISEELKERALLEWSYCMSTISEIIPAVGVKYIRQPFLFDGVIDYADYNVKKSGSINYT